MSHEADTRVYFDKVSVARSCKLWMSTSLTILSCYIVGWECIELVTVGRGTTARTVYGVAFVQYPVCQPSPTVLETFA